MEHMELQKRQCEPLSEMRNADTALEILSHGKKDRAEQTSLCFLCRHLNKSECLFPKIGKVGKCDGYGLDPSATEAQVLDRIRE